MPKPGAPLTPTAAQSVPGTIEATADRLPWLIEGQAEPEPRLRFASGYLVAFVLLWVATFLVLSPDPAGAIREHWALFPLGLLGAVIGNATAVGGGLIFVPATMWLYEMDPLSSLQLAIGCQAFGMTSGAIAWWRRGVVPSRPIAWGLPSLFFGCVLGGLVVRPDADIVKGLFGPVSIAIGVATLLLARHREDVDTVPLSARLGVMVLAAAGAVLTAWVAIGVGEVIAAYLMVRWRVRASAAVALGVAYLSICSIALAIGLALAGRLPWPQLAFMGLGCVLGARLGPFLAQAMPDRILKYGFAAIAIADGALFALRYGLS